MTTVAVLGTGIMGAPMARNLARAGLDVRAWNRSRAKAEPLAADAITVCDSPRAAAAGAEILVTMVTDAAAVEATVTGPDGAFAGGNRPLWLQMSTVGVEGCDRLAALAADAGVTFVDAPVLGTRQPAEKGELTVLGSGPDESREHAARVFDAVGSRTLWLGAAGAGSRLKLVVNSWVLALTTATAEAVGLAAALGIDPQQFFDTISGGPLDAGYAHLKGAMMAKREFPAAFPVDGARKDAGLVVDAAAGAGVHLLVAEAVRDQMATAEETGHGREDMAAVWYAVTSAT